MGLQTLIILFSVISFVPDQGRADIPYQKYGLAQGQYLIAQDWDELYLRPKSYPSPATQVTSTENINHEPLNPKTAFYSVLFPAIFLIPPLTPIGLITVTFLTIPAHVYVHDSILKTSLLTISKAGFATMITIGFLEGLGNLIGGMGCGLDESSNKNKNCSQYSSSTVDGFLVTGFIGFVGVYLYELSDISDAAKRYNEKIKQEQGFFVLPYAYKDQYRVNVGYRF